MIITVTPNPSVDRTVFINALPRGEVVRSERGQSEPSGKGVNVALALCSQGFEALAVLPIGGPAGAHMEEMLSAASLPYVTVAMKGEIRSNISLVEPDGTVTKINEAGPVLDSDELASLTAAAMSRSTGAAWIAGCGSLPPLGDQEFYANLVSESRRRHVKVAIDTSGLALHAAVNCHPDLIKPNVEELAAAADCALRTVGDVVDAAESLRRRGVGAVLASIGPDGAILVDASGALHGEALLTNVLSAVGAGDALLAGFLAAGGHGVDALRTGLAWASSAVQHEGTLYSGTPTTLPVRVHERINRERRLTDPPQKQPEPRVRLPGHS